MKVLLTNEMPYKMPKHYGPVMIRVEWASGEETVAIGSWNEVLDIVSGNCRPFSRWEITGSTLAPMRAANESWRDFGARLAKWELDDELPNYGWLDKASWDELVAGFEAGRDMLEGQRACQALRDGDEHRLGRRACDNQREMDE